jgi:hypothetical protein
MSIVTKFGFFLALLSLGVGIAGIFAPYEWPQIASSRFLRRATLAIAFALIIGSFACFIVIPDEEKPEVSLKFVYQKSPSLQIINDSGVLATNIKYGIAAWNLDYPDETMDFLPIPFSNLDLLPAKSASIPINIFQTPLVSPFVKIGSRIFGSASVTCPACSRGRTYWFYIEWGKGGWFSENAGVTNGNIVAPTFSKDAKKFANYVIANTPFYAQNQIGE